MPVNGRGPGPLRSVQHKYGLGKPLFQFTMEYATSLFTAGMYVLRQPGLLSIWRALEKPTTLLHKFINLCALQQQCNTRNRICSFTGTSHIPLVACREDGVFWTLIAQPYSQKLCRCSELARAQVCKGRDKALHLNGAHLMLELKAQPFPDAFTWFSRMCASGRKTLSEHGIVKYVRAPSASQRREEEMYEKHMFLLPGMFLWILKVLFSVV